MHRNHNTQSTIASESGQAIVEFALILPFLLFLLLAITQFGLAFHNYLAITDAARGQAGADGTVSLTNLVLLASGEG